MVDVTVVRDWEIQEALLREAPTPSKEEFMQILSRHPTSLRIVIEKKHER
jgi:hypothetical protein